MGRRSVQRTFSKRLFICGSQSFALTAERDDMRSASNVSLGPQFVFVRFKFAFPLRLIFICIHTAAQVFNKFSHGVIRAAENK